MDSFYITKYSFFMGQMKFIRYIFLRKMKKIQVEKREGKEYFCVLFLGFIRLLILRIFLIGVFFGEQG